MVEEYLVPHQVKSQSWVKKYKKYFDLMFALVNMPISKNSFLLSLIQASAVVSKTVNFILPSKGN